MNKRQQKRNKGKQEYNKSYAYIISACILILNAAFSAEAIYFLKIVLDDQIVEWNNNVDQAYMQVVILSIIQFIFVFGVLMMYIFKEKEHHEEKVKSIEDKEYLIENIEKLNLEIDKTKIFESSDGMWTYNTLKGFIDGLVERQVDRFACIRIQCKDVRLAQQFRLNCGYVLNNDVIRIKLSETDYLFIFVKYYEYEAMEAIKLILDSNIKVVNKYEADGTKDTTDGILEKLNIECGQQRND
jgi:hypothetical protein